MTIRFFDRGGHDAGVGDGRGIPGVDVEVKKGQRLL